MYPGRGHADTAGTITAKKEKKKKTKKPQKTRVQYVSKCKRQTINQSKSLKHALLDRVILTKT